MTDVKVPNDFRFPAISLNIVTQSFQKYLRVPTVQYLHIFFNGIPFIDRLDLYTSIVITVVAKALISYGQFYNDDLV